MAGLPLGRTLCLAQDRIPKRHRPAFQHAVQQVEQGQALAAALQLVPACFDTWTISLLSMAEYSGALAPVLEQLAHSQAAEVRHQRYLTSAWTSSLGFLSSLLILVGLLLGWSRVLILVSVMILAISFYGLAVMPQGQGLRRQLPILKSMMEAIAMIQLSYLAFPLQCGVSMLAAIDSLRQHIPNRYLRALLKRSRMALRQGQSLSDSLGPHLPHLAQQYIVAGEQSGHLEDMLQRIGHHYTQQLEHSTYRLHGILRPMGLLGLAGLVLWVGLQVVHQLQQQIAQ